ncbi:ADP-ribosylglycohydrolase family protein [Saccharopolyspora sp. NPDC000359]|uniref:ADP-ribosylglycohydrolase family protein n=1 Tax=Saccharopolyspora sp. NPDC000359 TaxID=3154251 RepID=UPI00332B1A91
MTDARPPQLSWAERFRGAMLGGAVGDALGAGVRHASAAEIHQWFGPQGVVDYLDGYGRRGAVTDLSQLTAFTLEAMLRAKAANPVSGGWLPKELVLANYLRWLHTQGVPWDHAMAAHLATEPSPTGWLLGRPELYSTRNPDGSAIALLGRLARLAPVGPDGLVHPPTDVDGSAEYAVLAAPAMVWSNMPGVVCSTASAIAHIFTSGRNAVAAAGLHGDVLAQLIRGVPLWDAVAASDRDRLGTAAPGEVAADVRRTVHAAMFVGQRGVRPSPADVDIEFDTENKPGELGIALAAVGSTRNFADALRVAVNHSSDSAVAGALAGQLAGAIHGVGGIPARWLDELELREVIEVLCADATEAFAPPPPPQWAQRYVPGSRPGPRELTAPHTVEGAAEQTMILPPVQDDVDTPPQGQPQQGPRSSGIGAPTFPSARADFAVGDPSSTGPIPVPNLRSAETPAETTAVLPAIDDRDAPQVGAFPPPNEARSTAGRIVVPSAAEVAGAPEPVAEPETSAQAAERAAGADESAERAAGGAAEAVPDVAAVAAVPEPAADLDDFGRESADLEEAAEPEAFAEHFDGVAGGRSGVPVTDLAPVEEPQEDFEVEPDGLEEASPAPNSGAAVDGAAVDQARAGLGVGEAAEPVPAEPVSGAELDDEVGEQETAEPVDRGAADDGDAPESNGAAESQDHQELAERIVRASAEVGRITVPDAGAVAAASQWAEQDDTADRELAERVVRESAGASRFAAPDVDEAPEPDTDPDPAEPTDEPVPTAAAPESATDDPADHDPADHEVAEREPADRELVGRESVDRGLADRESAGREPVDREVVDHEPLDSELVDRELVGRESVRHELVDREPALSGREPSDRGLVDREPADQEPADRGPEADEPERVTGVTAAPVEDDAASVEEASATSQVTVEREPVDLEPPARAPIDLEPAEPDEDVALAAEPGTPADDVDPPDRDTDRSEVDDDQGSDQDDDAGTPGEPSNAASSTGELASPAPRPRGGHAKADGPGDSAPSLTERVLGCFLGGALGDSLGSDLEFITAEAITARFGPDGPSGLREAYGVRGAITDDTQMTLFTAEGLIRGSIANRMLGSDDPLPEVQLAYQRWLHTQGVEWEAAAGAFLADYPAPDGWLIEVPGLFATRAPGKTVWRALARFGDGGPAGSFTERINDSKGCGGVMRAAPAALWSTDPAEVFRLAARTAALTHSHPAGYHSAGALAVIVQQALLGRGLDDGVWLALQVLETWEDHEETTAALKAAVDLAEAGEPTPEEVAERLGGGWVGEEALAIAVCAALVGEDVEQALRIAVHHGGDSDSTGAICGNIVGALHGVAALPVDWLADLELRDVVEQAALDCVAEFGRDAFQPGPAAIEPPTSEDWNERYPVRPHWSAAPEPVAAAPGPEFPAPKPAPRRFTGVRHDELSEGEDE